MTANSTNPVPASAAIREKVSIRVKVCGLSTAPTLDAALKAGVSHVGFVFYPPSPRAITPDEAARLAAPVPADVQRVAVTVDAGDAVLDAIVARLAPNILQLHGSESPERVADLQQRYGLAVMKAIRVAGPDDIASTARFEGIADAFLFDARPPPDATGALPGGNGLAFDWRLLADYAGPTPWFLSGGLDADSVADALAISHARALDVSSGVESSPGEKKPEKIHQFLRAVRAYEAGR